MALDLEKWQNTIYINTNPGYNLASVLDNVEVEKVEIVKIGSSKCLPLRYQSYKTYSPVATHIYAFYHIHEYDCYVLDDDIKRDLDSYRIHSSGGIEFYYSTILEHLEKYFQSRYIAYTRYDDITDFPPTNQFLENTSTMLEELTRDLQKSISSAQSISSIEKLLSQELNIHQRGILQQTLDYFSQHSSKPAQGILNLFCRYGKTRLSSLFALAASYKKILVLVPSLYLIGQTRDTWKAYHPEEYIYCISSQSSDITVDNNINKIYSSFEKIIFISTYHSSHKLDEYNFDLCIYDEAHRTSGDISIYNKLVKSSHIMHKLFLTATMKFYDALEADSLELKVNSMDNEDIYGQVIAKVSARKALQLGRICPYSIITIKLDDHLPDEKLLQSLEEYIICDNKYQEILESSSSLEDDSSKNKIQEFLKTNLARYIRTAIGLFHIIARYGFKHLITYHRYIASAKLFKFILNQVSSKYYLAKLDTIPKISTMVITGQDSRLARKTCIDNFQTLAPKIDCNILCNAKVMTEGVDVPVCDAVLFVDLKTSAVDTVQSLARCLTFQPAKKAYMLIPFQMEDLEGSKSDESDSSTLDIKPSRYALDLRLLLRNLIEIDENIKEIFRNLISRAQSKQHGTIIQDSSVLEPNIELLECLVDDNLILDMSEIVYETLAGAKAKIKGLYNTPEEYKSLVASKFGQDLPLDPDIVYRKWGWHGWNDYLGIDPYMTLSQIRRHMHAVNTARDLANQPRIETALAYREYAKSAGLMVLAQPRNGNWCWLLLPDYEELQSHYYKTKEEITNAIRALGIKSIQDYERLQVKDQYLAPYKYIANGFYNETIPSLGKNISEFINSIHYVDDCMF